MKQLYLDYAASTPVSEQVLKAMKPWFMSSFANASSSHTYGLDVSKAIDEARTIIANKIGAMPSEIIFTSGASESNNMAIKGIALANLENKGHIITSSIEHKCILNTCSYLETLGFRVSYIEPELNGLINPMDVQNAIESDTILISIHHVNNELGTIQSIAEVGEIAFFNNIPFHTDAAQSFCKLHIDVDELNIDMLSLSGHKIYGPKGIGVLYIRNARNTRLVPLIHGASQELGLRGGTSATPLIIGLAEAVKIFPHNDNGYLNQLTDILSSFDYQRNSAGQSVKSIWNITFSSTEESNKFFSRYNVAISQGSACNALSNKASHVLFAIGFDDDKARRTYRFSIPPFSQS